MSYLLGSDPAAWHAAVPVWHEVRYAELYPGVDLVFDGSDGASWRLEAGAGADLSAVRLRIEGADAATLDGDGVRLTTDAGEVLLPLLRLSGSSARGSLPAPTLQMRTPDASLAGAAAVRGGCAVCP